MQCLCPNALLWDRVLHRDVLGIERLAIQGVFVDPCTLENYKDSDLNDLAGNAYPCKVVWMLQMCVAMQRAKVRKADWAFDAMLHATPAPPRAQARIDNDIDIDSAPSEAGSNIEDGFGDLDALADL